MRKLVRWCTALATAVAGVMLSSPPAQANHNGPGCVVGAIAGRYAALGGAQGFLGNELTCESGTPVRFGRYNHFQGGSIYWSPAAGAWEVHGGIRDAWARLGWENSPLGFPTTNEMGTPFRPGRFNHFQSGSVYWSPATGAHAVYGAIRRRWADQGWENGPLGFPTSAEHAIPGGRRSYFQGGHIDWNPTDGASVNVVGAVGCSTEPVGPVTNEMAAACLREAWKRGDQRLAESYATPTAIAALFFNEDGTPTPHTGEYDLVDGPNCQPTDVGISCWWNIPDPDPRFHGVGVEMFMGGPPSDAYVGNVAFYG